MPNINDELFHQIDYLALDEKEKISFIEMLVQQYGIDSVVSEIAAVLQSNTEKKIFIVSLLLRDFSLQRRQTQGFNQLVTEFRQAVEKSEIFRLMNQNLYSNDRLIRETTYVTFGKTAFPQGIQYLKEAIEYYGEHFPDQSERLQFEYNWLLHVAQ